MSKAKKIVLRLLEAWQWTRRFRRPACRFYPSCSEYARQAIEKHGLARGLSLGVVRICKCHPFHDGGVDEVPETVQPRFAGIKVFGANAACFSHQAARTPTLRVNRYENRSKTGFCRKQR